MSKKVVLAGAVRTAIGKMGGAPVNNLFLYRFRQFKSEKQPFRLGHDRDSVMNYGDATMLALEC